MGNYDLWDKGKPRSESLRGFVVRDGKLEATCLPPGASSIWPRPWYKAIRYGLANWWRSVVLG